VSVRLSYLDFHLLFVLPVLAVLSAVTYRRRSLTRVRWLGLGVMVVLALGYTTPWDNYLILQDVWWYGEGTVASRLWAAPVEEYLFILFQTVAAGLWVYHVAPDRAPAFEITWRGRLAGGLAGLGVGVVGLALLRTEATFYMGAILAWAGPVLAVQWAFGWPYLLRVKRAFALGVAVPTLYFAVSDRIAIALGIWELSAAKTTGITVAGLPIEEGAFFFVTNVFLAQGLLLYQWLYERWERDGTGGIA
jgi:hypothetical protein